MFKISIDSSFAPSAFFKISRNTDGVFVFWRIGLKDSQFRTELIKNVVLENPCCEILSIQEYIKSKEYTRRMNAICPLKHQKLNDIQTALVNALMHTGLDTDVKFSHGRDGHSFELELYRSGIEKYRCWCVLPKEWKQFGEVIDFLVNDIANLEKGMYGVSGYTE